MIPRICRTKKKGFPTKEAAEAEVKRILAYHAPIEAGRKAPTNINECPYCFEFHLTRDEKWTKKKPGRRNGQQKRAWGSQ